MLVVFISYRREDSAGYAGRLHEELEGRFGAGRIFRDVDTLRPGQDFEDAIREQLMQCQACVVMIGPGWLKSQDAAGQRRLDKPTDFVAMEIAAALKRPDVLVVPLLVGGATMPAPDDLPERIRPLARRHALTARDETWEADMDRLALTLNPDTRAVERHESKAASWPASLRRFAAPLGVAILVLIAAVFFARQRAAVPAEPNVSTNQAGAASATDPDSAAAAATGQASAIEIPTSGAEVSHGDIIYTPVAGSLQPRGAVKRVWIRLRVSNEGYYSANVWDDSFRLLVGGSAVAPNGALNEILERRSIRQYVIRFDVPSTQSRAILRILDKDQSGDIPLDLTSSGSPAKHDEADPGDAFSRATFTSISTVDQPLLDADGLVTTLRRISNRHFVNKQRITVGVTWMNNGRYAIASGDLILRLASGGDTRAPVKEPSEVIAAGARLSDDVVFELPPQARQGVLTATIHGKTREVPLEVK